MKESSRADKGLLERAFDFQKEGSLNEARASYLRHLELAPYDDHALYLLGLLEAQSGDLGYSSRLMGRALVMRPNHPMAHWHMGEAFIQLEFYMAAVASFRRARNSDPGFKEAMIREGNVLLFLGHPQEALDPYRRALFLDSINCDVHFSLANCYKSLGRFRESIRHYRLSIALRPEWPDPYINLGNALKELNLLDTAVRSHQLAGKIQPREALHRFNESLILLLQGDLKRGFERFESRWDVVLREEKRHFKQPLWTGREDIRGKSLFVYCEQGLGDTLQFCRYLPTLSSLGIRVIFEAQPEVRDLMGSLKGAITLLRQGCMPPHFDYHIPLLSIPRVLGTSLDTIPSSTPYLVAPYERRAFWDKRVGPSTRPRVGLVWAGGSIFRNDGNRSLAIESLVSVLSLPLEFHVLQKTLKPGDSEVLRQHANVQFYGEHLHDFSDTAALIESMDLVCSVDTSVAHLAGAMGKPVWILLPFAPDFRWLLDREDSPWYPTARLFRQREIKEWGSVITHLRSGLIAHFDLQVEGGDRTSSHAIKDWAQQDILGPETTGLPSQ